MSKKLDLSTIPSRVGSSYPKPFGEPCQQRERKALGEAAGLTQFGINLLRLPPGAWSSQRHWHTSEDEFVYVLAGEVVLVSDDGGEEILRRGDCAGFRAGEANGHHLQNRSDKDAILLELGGRDADDVVTYPDIDLLWTGQADRYLHRDGTPYD